MSIFSKIGKFFQNLFGKEFAFLKANSKFAVDVVNKLKAVVESPIADVVVSIIPSDIDNKILEKLRVIVPKVAETMAIEYGIIQAANTNSDALGAIIEDLKKKLPGGRVGFWMDFAGRLNVALADGKLTATEAAALAQIVYQEFYGK